jgi:hypothetical protein
MRTPATCDFLDHLPFMLRQFRGVSLGLDMGPRHFGAGRRLRHREVRPRPRETHPVARGEPPVL